MSAQSQADETTDGLIEVYRALAHTLTVREMNLVTLYARLFACSQVERVAQEEHRRGRHTLANSLAERARELRK